MESESPRKGEEELDGVPDLVEAVAGGPQPDPIQIQVQSPEAEPIPNEIPVTNLLTQTDKEFLALPEPEETRENNGSDESLKVKPSVGFALDEPSNSFDKDWDDEFQRAEDELVPLDEQLWRTDITYEKLVEIYHVTLAGLDGSEREGVSLDPVKKLFTTIWEGVERSHENVVRLQKKDYDISTELSTVMAKTRTLIKLAEDDPEVAARLRSKLEVAWNLADVGETEEKNNAFRIQELKEEIAILNRNILAASKAEGQETIYELHRIKAELEAEKLTHTTEVAAFQSELDLLYLKRQTLAETKAQLEEMMKMLLEEERVQKAAAAREQKRKEAIEASIREAINNIYNKRNELRGIGRSLSSGQSQLNAAERNVKEQRMLNEEAQRGMELSLNKVEKMKSDFEAQTKLCERLTIELFKKQADLKEKEEEIVGMRQEIVLATRQLVSNQKKVALHKVTVEQLEEDREILKGKLSILEKDLELAQKKLEENKRKVEELDKNRGSINRTLQRAVAVTNEHISQSTTHELAVRNLQVELAGYEKEIGQQQSCIARLERERDNYSHEALKLAHQVAIRLEEVKKLDMSIYEYRKKLGEIEGQLKKIQQIYETAVYDRQLLHRTLRDTQKDIFENMVKITHLGHKITSLKFQLTEKDNIIHREVMIYERLIKDTVFFTGEAKRIKRMAHDIQRMVEALDIERSTLGRTIAEAEAEISKQNYYANSSESRMEMYMRKLMLKEKELREIWEKWRALHSNIRIGAYHFRNIMTEIREIRLEIFQAKKKNLILNSTTTNMRKMKHEVVVLENIISKETCMCNSLRESMKHPINVHRWRVLQATNPDAYDMVQKVNLLTKRLVDRNSLLGKQSEDLKFKQEIYCQIREAMKKSPGLEAPENVTYYRHLQSAKTQQYEALKYELKAAESQTEYYQEEIRRLHDRHRKIKEKYFRRQKGWGRKICHEYYPLPLEMEDYDPDNEERSAEGIISGVGEWETSDASSLTLFDSLSAGDGRSRATILSQQPSFQRSIPPSLKASSLRMMGLNASKKSLAPQKTKIKITDSLVKTP